MIYLHRISDATQLTTRDIGRMFAALAGRRTRYGKPIAPSTLHRIRATLRAALNAAVREGLIASNPARMTRLPASSRPYPQVWTDRRVAAWRREGEHPTVAVWTADQLAEFLTFARHDRLHVLWQLIALRGLRRGEAAGLRWIDLDLDLDRRELAVNRQLVRTDAGVIVCPPKAPPASGSSSWIRKLFACCAVTSRPSGTASLALACGSDLRVVQHRGDLRHLHLSAARGVSPLSPGDRAAGPGQGAQDRPQSPEGGGLTK
ncbi:site-specific integrase [Nonomuraea guangzhouensis]|uniref:Tyrosine recombinase XerC n=1 Tax=Nonomuraea guangzhouensis TaxID=1291555 RepID=A0ABW4GX80_9ACTN|nr:site-specific integrase [Nonomuraea guangzhouensis]